MPRRWPGGADLTVKGGLVVAAAVGLASSAPLLAGCQNDAATAGCQLAQQVMLAPSALTLLPAARLDRVRDGFVLIGADTTDLRWAPLDAATGQLGAEQAMVLGDATAAGVWFGVAGAQGPGDSVVAAVGRPAAGGAGGVELRVQAAPIDDGGAASVAGPVLATVPGDVAAARSQVAMASSRNGMVAALAWREQGRGLFVNMLSGAGDVVGSTLTIDTTPDIACIGFHAGKSDLTLGYYKYVEGSNPTPGAPIPPTFVLVELRESGAEESSLALPLTTTDAACPMLVPTERGYALAWQDSVGTWLSVYDAATNRIFAYPIAGAVAFGGPQLQPPLAGFAPLAGGDYAVVLRQIAGAELWRLSPVGGHRGTLGFPSSLGELGAVSSVPGGGGLYATYADYTGADVDAGVGGRAGQRYFLQAACQ